MAADSRPGGLPGTLRVLSVQVMGVFGGTGGAKPKIPITAPPSEATISSGGTPPPVPLRSPTTSGPCTGVSLHTRSSRALSS